MLGHGHADHRGIAAGLGVPVLCHEDERADVEGDGGYHYFKLDRIGPRFPRTVYPTLLKHWDGGPAKVAETRRRGRRDRRLHRQALPRPRPRDDRPLARERPASSSCSDTTYFVDSMKFKPVDWANVPNRVFNRDHDVAIASLRKMAALEPRTVAAGHAEPMVEEPAAMRMLLEQAANRG